LNTFAWQSYLNNRFNRIVMPAVIVYIVSLFVGLTAKLFDIDVLYFGSLLLLGRFPYNGPGN
jgi:hypothetical protein